MECYSAIWSTDTGYVDEPLKHHAKSKTGTKGNIFHLYEISRVGKYTKTEYRLIVAKG